MPKSTDGWQLHERDQMRARLALSYSERLRWLEQAKRFTRSALGAANSNAARIATFARMLWPDARVTLRTYRDAWTMDIAVATRFVVVDHRPGEGFGVSELHDDARGAFTGHLRVFATVAELEARLKTLSGKR
jgi:hypothetical protein